MLQCKIGRKTPKSTTGTGLIEGLALIPAGNMPDIPQQPLEGLLARTGGREAACQIFER